jgi:hypothetical protein
VRIARWIRNHTLPDYIPAPPGMRVDQWATYDFVVPGVFLLSTTSYAVGTVDAHPHGPIDLEPLYTTITSQAVTPISEKETVYRYSGGLPAKQATEERVKVRVASLGVAFLEDKVMIESQQKGIDHSPGKRMMTLGFDRSVAQFRRLMADLISAEASPEGRRSLQSPEPVTSIAAGE